MRTYKRKYGHKGSEEGRRSRLKVHKGMEEGLRYRKLDCKGN